MEFLPKVQFSLAGALLAVLVANVFSALVGIDKTWEFDAFVAVAGGAFTYYIMFCRNNL